MTLEEYGKSNYRILDSYQTQLFISNGAEINKTIVTVNKNGKYTLVHLFEKNKFNEDLLNKYHRRELTFGDNVVIFEG